MKYLQDGLDLTDLNPEGRRAMAFELGTVLETLGRNGEALRHYQAVAAEERGFRDVAARIQRLGNGSVRPRAPGKPAATPAGRPLPATAAAEKKPPGTGASSNRKIGFV